MTKWYARGGGIAKAGPFDTESEAAASLINVDGVPVEGAFVWPVEEDPPRRGKKGRVPMKIESKTVIEPVGKTDARLLVVTVLNGVELSPIVAASGPRSDIEAFAKGKIDWDTLAARILHTRARRAVPVHA